MKQESELFAFENKYPFLYEILVGGVPIYTSYRDAIVQILRDGTEAVSSVQAQGKDGISIKRIISGFFKKRKFKKKQTLIFTSTIYRRDKGRNLAAEYLMDKYPSACVFEWSRRNAEYDNAYFTDVNKDKYCPLDYFSVRLKLYSLFHKKEYARLCEECRQIILPQFEKTPAETENEKRAVAYLLENLPDSYATTVIYQKLFGKYFKGYKNVQYAVDFWGGARENIIPALKNNPQSIELQHGIIMSYHAGYIYPKFVKDSQLDFFKRKLLVYGEATKTLLVENSIFDEDKIEVIGNPRIQKYKEIQSMESEDRKLIVFASQSYEQDGTGIDYYKSVIKILKSVQAEMQKDSFWKEYRLGVKLHPRESENAMKLYQQELLGIEVYGNTSQLFEILNKTFVQLTVSSTTLYEAAQFDAPTVSVKYADYKPLAIYGFETWLMEDEKSVESIMQKLKDKIEYDKYLNYLKTKTQEDM